MLAILPESAARTRRSPGGIAWSLLLHGGAATLVTLLSGYNEDLSSTPTSTAPDTVIYIPMPSGPVGGGGGPVRPRQPDSGPVTPVVPAPIVVPNGVLPPDHAVAPVELILGGADTDARRILGSRGTGAGSAAPGCFPHCALSLAPERVAAALPDNPRPRYPDVLRVARLEGNVLVDCVVDTSGMIDPSTVRIIESDHAHFTEAVREVLPRLRFAPAESGGRRVRQWVRIPFEFRLSTR